MPSPTPWRIDCTCRTRAFGSEGTSQPNFYISQYRRIKTEDRSLSVESQGTKMAPGKNNKPLDDTNWSVQAERNQKRVPRTSPPNTVSHISAAASLLFALADGVGIRSKRTQACRLILNSVTSVSDRLLGLLNAGTNDDQINHEFDEALRECEHSLRESSADDDSPSQLAGMLTLGLLSIPKSYIAHVGSARVYHIRSDVLHQVTSDHTMASRLVEAGKLTPRRAASSQLRHIIWNVISSTQQPYVEKHILKVKWGDSLLLCSDAVASSLLESEILATLTSSLSTEGMCDRLLAMASRRNAEGHGTIILARFFAKEDAIRQQRGSQHHPSSTLLSANKPSQPMTNKGGFDNREVLIKTNRLATLEPLPLPVLDDS